MKKIYIAAALLAALPLAAAPSSLKSAKVTQIHNDVRLSAAAAAAQDGGLDPAPPRGAGMSADRPAVIGDMVEGAKTLRTGQKSRAELLFNDNTVARLGANSVFSFKPGSRDLDLKSGYLLLHTPKGNGGANISTPSAAASVLGTTIMLSALPNGGMKLVVLEGTASINSNGTTQLVQAGQLVFLTPGQGMSPPITVDLARLMASSGLVKNFSGPIGSEQLIQEAISDQAELLSEGDLADTGITIGGDENGLNVVNNSALKTLLDAFTKVTLQPGKGPPPSPIPPESIVFPPVDPDTVDTNITTGVLRLGQNFTIDYNVGDGFASVRNNQSGGTLFGLNEEGDVIFSMDRLLVTGTRPAEIDTESALSLTFEASGQSVNFIDSFNAILFDGFNDAGGTGQPSHYSFNALRGGIRILGTTLARAGSIFLGTLGLDDGETGPAAGPINVVESFLGAPEQGEPYSHTLLLTSLGGDVNVHDSELRTRAAEVFPEDVFLPEGETPWQGGIFLTAAGGNVNIDGGSILSTEGDALAVGGELGGDAGQGIYVAAEQNVRIYDSTLQTALNAPASEAIEAQQVVAGGPIQIIAFGDQGQVWMNNATVHSAAGNTAGPISIVTPPENGMVNIANSTVSAVSDSGAAAPVSIVGRVINIETTVIKGSVVDIGNPDKTAAINFIGDSAKNQIWTTEGTAGFIRNGTQSGDVTVGILGSGQKPVVVSPGTPVGP